MPGEVLGRGAARKRDRAHAVLLYDGGDFTFAFGRGVVDEGVIELVADLRGRDPLQLLEVDDHTPFRQRIRTGDGDVDAIGVSVKIATEPLVISEDVRGIEPDGLGNGGHGKVKK